MKKSHFYIFASIVTAAGIGASIYGVRNDKKNITTIGNISIGYGIALLASAITDTVKYKA